MGTFTLLYVAQGIPIGLLSIALPGWFAASEMSAERIATFISITGLPWGFKLIAGPFMDRFTFLAMGYRRPWVIAAQGGLMLAMLAMTSISDPDGQFWAMLSIGFIINCFGALQDVGVDGMAIDILPEHERGRANAFMAFGQVAGFSVYGALCGAMLNRLGLPLTALVCAASIAAIFAWGVLIRERVGERALPWSPGEASPRQYHPAKSFRVIFRDLLKVLFLPMSLNLTAVEFISRIAAGVGLAITPLIAVQQLGYSSEQYAFWISAASGISAVAGLFFGPLVDRFGAKRLLMIGIVLSAGSAAAFATAQSLWGSDSFVAGILLISNIGSQMVFVAVLAAYMSICWNKVAATQFSVYMSLANLARSVGAGLYGFIAASITNVEAVWLLAGLLALAAVVLSGFNLESHRARMTSIAAAEAAAEG